jgi:Ca2+-binding EF-hand superfamily protein
MTTFMITDQIWSKKLDGLIKIQISEWQQHYNTLDKDGDGNGRISIDEFASGHQNIMEIIGNQFFDGKKEINFDQYCLYMVLFSDQDACYEINESRIKKVYNDYCKMRQCYNGRIKISDFLDKNNDLLTIAQFEDILQRISNSMSFDFTPGEINYMQFKEFVESMQKLALTLRIL